MCANATKQDKIAKPNIMQIEWTHKEEADQMRRRGATWLFSEWGANGEEKTEERES